ncbi:TPA: hypothetical protein NPP60_005040 [Klebsiella variicola subsp. variicola]|nr:hypothetical protein [Klebsiella variicola subsp. variicola]
MSQHKVIIAVITTGERQISKKVFEASSYPVEIFVDEERKGDVYMRNKILAKYKDYDHIFTFDDDCYPERKGWEDYFITQAKLHNVHYMGVPAALEDLKLIAIDNEMTWWEGAISAFQYFSKHGLETIGGYNTKYNYYGYADIAMGQRAARAGITGKFRGSAFPLRGLMYIHSMDICHDNPKPVISDDVKKRCIAENHAIFLEEMSSEQLHYPYE